MCSLKDISTREDIILLVDTFYGKVKTDSLLGNIFDTKIQDRWPEHLDKMYCFWETVLLNVHSYHGSPFAPHARLPIDGEHFDRWLLLFKDTANSLFQGEKTDEAIWRASKMAEMFRHKIDYFKNKPENFPG